MKHDYDFDNCQIKTPHYNCTKKYKNKVSHAHLIIKLVKYCMNSQRLTLAGPLLGFASMCYIALNTDKKLVDFLNKMNLTRSILATSARGHKGYPAITYYYGH